MNVSTTELTAPVAAPAPELSGRKLVPIFAGLLVAMFLAALDQTIFSTALPPSSVNCTASTTCCG